MTFLPVTDPDFKYPPSKNPYSAKNRELGGRIFSDHETEEHRGKWREIFPDGPAGARPSRELHVEIGCNAGHVTLEWAKANPAHAYIGLDWKFKIIHRAAEKAIQRGLGNVLFFRAHAERLHFMFAPGEIDALYLFFPDPWPRKKQWKNRFVTAANLRHLAEPLKKGGIFHIKTDHAGYFEWMEAAIAEVSDLFKVTEKTRDLHGAHPDPKSLTIPEVTLFERLFIKDGLPIHSVKLEKLDPLAVPPELDTQR